MITDLVTIFGRSVGHVIRTADELEVLVVSAGAEKLLRDRRSVDTEAVDKMLEKHGGFAASVTTDRVLRLKMASVSSYRQPERALYISPNKGGTFVILDQFNKGVSIPAGGHLVIPEDAAAEKQLEQFDELLGLLPSDRAILIKELIRSPSLDWRLAQLEEQVARLPAPRRRPRALDGRWWSMPRFISVRATVATAIIVGVLLGAGFALWHATGLDFQSNQESNQKIETAVSDLRTVLLAAAGPRVTQVRDTHLPTLSSTTPATDLLGQQHFVWTLLKLFLVKTRNASDTAALADASPSQLKLRELLAIEYPKGTGMNAMLAYASCGVWNKPSLPKIDADHPEVLFGTDCSAVSPDQAAEEFASLAKWLDALPGSNPPLPSAIEKAVDNLRNELLTAAGRRVTAVRSAHLPGLSKETPAAEFLEEKGLVWALTKLFLVKTILQADETTAALADTTGEQRATRDLLVKEFPYDQGFAKMPQDMSTMLAYASCLAWNSPSLPPVSAEHPELVFLRVRCADVSPDKTALGFTSLATWLHGLANKTQN